MTTHPSDFVRLNMTIGVQNIPCVALGLEWPPPERITELLGKPVEPAFVRVRMSQLTDEQADHPNLARGAEYIYEDRVPT